MTPKAISLYYSGGTSDKVYNVQLLYEASGTWAVHAQNGRRGAGLTPRVKGKGLTYGEALRLYHEVVDSKLHHPSTPYVSGVLNRESAKALATPPASSPLGSAAQTTVLDVPAPRWDGWDICLQEAAAILGVSSAVLATGGKNPSVAYASVVVLADLILGQPEGAQDAARICSEGEAAIKSAMSPDCKLWLVLLSGTHQAQVLKGLQDNVATRLGV